MLAVLDHIRPEESDSDLRRFARAAIAKATGQEQSHETEPDHTPGLGAFKDTAELEGLTIKPKERKR
jgi:hypothetical protein